MRGTGAPCSPGDRLVDPFAICYTLTGGAPSQLKDDRSNIQPKSRRAAVRGLHIVTALLVVTAGTAHAQEPRPAAGGFDLAGQALWSHQLGDAGAPNDQAVGVGVAVGYGFPVGIGVELRGTYRSWEQETYVPLQLGVRYELLVSSVVTLAPFAGVGPCLVTGGDWSSVFASLDAGARAHVSLGAGAPLRLLLEVSYARAMAFHPSAFDVVNAGAGLRLRL
jgi:hypothetical protein